MKASTSRRSWMVTSSSFLPSLSSSERTRLACPATVGPSKTGRTIGGMLTKVGPPGLAADEPPPWPPPPFAWAPVAKPSARRLEMSPAAARDRHFPSLLVDNPHSLAQLDPADFGDRNRE